MSLERYVQWGYESFKDNKTGEIDYDYIKLLNQQAERIAELEEQLKNATKQVRKEVCEEIRKKVIESTCYDTEEEIRSVIYDLNACEVLEILDKLQGETKCQE